MGFVHKGGVWCFLLLAGVLLAAAAAGAEQDDGAVVTAAPEVEEEVGRRVDGQGNDSCDIKCQHHQVPARKKQCVDECHSREHHHPSRASCETKCSLWQDPTRKEQCVQQCMRRGLSVDVGGSNGVNEHPHAQEEEPGRRSNDMCDKKCQHHQVPARKKQCVDECHSREHRPPSRKSCETKCSHWVDPTRKEQCVQYCMRYGLSLNAGGSNAVDERPHAQEEEVARRACDWECRLSCQTKCKNWKDRTKHQECVRQCIRGSNSAVDEQLRGWEAVAGAIIEAV
ncbi:antimicrobial peptides [Triticum aestivum]|uniref:antimicrobial peptides n=1 Tax=Triticum aestivum TaxID=4565 RepID=UPI001D00898C|nr:antimicrobial peptides-like [Triticum aestivum]